MTLKLNEQLRARLHQLVDAGQISSIDEGVNLAVADLVRLAEDDMEWARPYVEAGRRDVAAGRVVDGEDVIAWLRGDLALRRILLAGAPVRHGALRRLSGGPCHRPERPLSEPPSPRSDPWCACPGTTRPGALRRPRGDLASAFPSPQRHEALSLHVREHAPLGRASKSEMRRTRARTTWACLRRKNQWGGCYGASRPSQSSIKCFKSLPHGAMAEIG
jgi:predicted transcriptional regulator